MKRNLVYILASAFLTFANAGGLPIPDSQDQWPMASGPYGTWTVSTDEVIPSDWSVSTDRNILWKTELPEGGQSGIAIWGNRLFLTINRPLPDGTPLDEAEGSDIVGYCMNSNTGEVLWTVELPSNKTMPYSGLFSDNSSATPMTDGRRVWFINHGGLMACFDMQGNPIWSRTFESRSRHNAKQCEPILVDNQILFVMMLDPEDPQRRPMKAEPGNRNTPAEWWPWTYVRAFDADSGTPLWNESAGTSVHNTPRVGYVGNQAVVFHARGGGHQPPESPFGFSLSVASGDRAGATHWSHNSSGVVAYTVSHFDEHFAYGFDRGSLLKLDATNGSLRDEFPVFEIATIRTWNSRLGEYDLHREAPFSVVVEKFKKEPTNQTAILVGKYFLFLTHEGHCIGRVNTENGHTEYLQVPVQVVRSPNSPDEVLWNRHIPSNGSNSRGMKTANDRRSTGDGWGHVTAGSPIAVNDYVYFSTMIGMTYVVDSQQAVFDESALVSINDLGSAGSTWSLSSPAYANRKLYHRGLRHVVCIGSE